MKCHFFGIAAAALVASFVNGALAREVAVCAASQGRAYYPYRGMMPETQAGWKNDGISNGSITLSREGDKWVVLHQDASGKVFSSRNQGALVETVAVSKDSATLLVVY